MPNERLPYKGLSPVARPVDTYAAPMAPAVAKPGNEGSGLMELAKALEQVNPSLQKFFGKQMEDQQKTAEAKGRFLFARNKNREKFNEHLDDIKKSDPERYEELAGANPHLAIGWNKAWLEGKAMEYNDALGITMAENPTVALEDGREVSVFGSNDQGVVNQFLGEHLQGFMAENGLDQLDPVDVSEVFLPKAQAYQKSWVAQNASERRRQMVQGRVLQLGTTATLQLREMVQTEQFAVDPDGAAAGVGQRLTEAIREAYDDGVRDRNALNTQVIESVTTAARRLNDPSLLDVLDHIETSPGNTLGSTKEAQAAKLRTEEAIFQKEIQLENLHYQREQRRKEEIKDEVAGSAMEKLWKAKRGLFEDVSDVDIEPEIARLREAGMMFEAETLMSMQQRMISAEENIQNDDATLYELTEGVTSGTVTRLDVMRAHAMEEIDEPTAKSLMGDIAQLDRYRQDNLDRIISDGTSTVRKAITGNEGVYNTMDPGDPMFRKAITAEMEYKARLRARIKREEEKLGVERLDRDQLDTLSDAVLTDILNSRRYQGTEQPSVPVATPQQVIEAENTAGAAPSNPSLRKQPLFSLEELDAEVTRWRGGDPNNRLVGLAQYLGIPVEQLVEEQGKLHGVKLSTE